MSIARYLWTVARDLKVQVYPGTAAGVPRDALDNSIHILTVLANALEAEGPPAIDRPPSARPATTRADTDRLSGPAENSAAYGDTAAALAAAAQALDAAGNPDVLRQADLLDHVHWEKALLDAAMTRMDAIETAAPAAEHDAKLEMDPKAVQAFLRKRLSRGDLVVTDFQQALGGRSRQTAFFGIRDASGAVQQLVVQRMIPGLAAGPAFASVAAQYHVLERVHAANLKVPKPVCFDSGDDSLGSPFLIVERSRGAIVEPDYWALPKSGAVALQLAEQMGRLHALPIGETASLVPHSRERGDRQGWLDELDRLAREWHALTHWPSVTVSAALAWLRTHVDCVEDRRSLVHNDMVFHNILAEGDTLTAVLDWEQVSVGHPAEDLGYCYPIVSATVDWRTFLETYYAAGGPRISPREVDYFALRAVLRLMNLVLKGGRDAYENGHADGVLVASAGAFFSQRLLRRFAQVLASVIERDRSA